jgi:hypothetical protein
MEGGFDVGTADSAFRTAQEATAVMADWSADDPAIRVGDQLLYVSHRPVDGEGGDLPARARYKVHSARLADLTRLVTLIIYADAGGRRGLHETVVSTSATRDEGDVLARGYGLGDQPMILVFRLESGLASLASTG